MNFSNVSRVPALTAVSYDETSGNFLMGGESTIVVYIFGVNPVPCNLRTLPEPGQINALYENIAVGYSGNMMAAGATWCLDGNNVTKDESVPSNSPVFNDAQGGSDIFVVGDAGTILRRESGPAPVTATPVPTLSEWGSILLFLVMVVFGAWALKKRRANFLSNAG